MKKNFYIAILIFAILICVTSSNSQTTISNKELFVIKKGQIPELSSVLEEVKLGIYVSYIEPEESLILFSNDPTEQSVTITADKSFRTAQIISREVKINASTTIKQFFIIKSAPNEIFAETTVLDFKTVRDNFGKNIGENFVVVQLNIRNQSIDSQFFTPGYRNWF